MKKISFSINIQAPKEKVWNILWDDETYRKWTAVFNENSHAVSDWQEGSRIKFLSADGNGMYGVIDKKIPNKQMTFRHLGVIKEGVEVPPDAESGNWEDAIESYFLAERNGMTELKVEMNGTEEWEQYFQETFPKALEVVKQIAEQTNKRVIQKITPFLWFNGNAEEAIHFYTTIFNNAKVGAANRQGDAFISGSFELEGQQFIALNGGPQFKFNEAVSFFVSCETQAEVDYYWEKLTAGGAPGQCGWLKDKYGLSWQIIPKALGELMNDPDPAKAQNVLNAMLQMRKIDIHQLQQAHAL